MRRAGKHKELTASCPCCPARGLFYSGGGAGRPRRGIVDVHAHLTPPQYLHDLAGTNLLQPPTLGWTPRKHIEDMDRAEVSLAILSVTTPGVWFGDVGKGRRISRYTNDYAAKLAGDHPGRFGHFTAIPLPDVEGSLREIEYGLDALKSDGVSLFTNYDGRWLGYPAFDPVFEELNRRKAVVYVHPISAPCCLNALPWLPDAVIEYGTDTTRAIASYVFQGAARRFPDVTMIWSHAGGTMPFLVERFGMGEKLPAVRGNVPDGFLAEARRFFYDTAQASNVVAMGALRQVVPATQIVFGTDFPFRTAIDHVKALEDGGVFSDAELKRIWRGNAARVLPRYAA